MTEQNRNYHLDYLKTVADLKKRHVRPRLFLHACCGPCLAYPLTELVQYFDVTVGYLNSNIYPQAEFDLRESELRRFVAELNRETGLAVRVISAPYGYDSFKPLLDKYGPLPEGGERCTFCHFQRLDRAYALAAEGRYDYFTTVMTVSSRKPSALLNAIGLELNRKYSETAYLVSDFKKEDGQLKGIKIAKAHHLYRQNYCGCSYSLTERKLNELKS